MQGHPRRRFSFVRHALHPLSRFFHRLRAGSGAGLAAALLGTWLVWMLLAQHALLPDTLAPMRLALFDRYQTSLPRQPIADPVVLVEVDEASLKALGQWPWPRHYMAALIDAIAGARPAVIGIDILFAEPDQTSPGALAESRADLPPEVLAALRMAQTNDGILATSMAAAPVVLGAAGFNYPTSNTREGMRTWPIVVAGANPVAKVPGYSHVLASMPELQTRARGQALLSSEPEGGVVRRVSLVSALQSHLVPGLALEMLRVAQGLPAIRVEGHAQGVRGAWVGEQFIPLQPNGEAWVHFDASSGAEPDTASAAGQKRSRSVSAVAVLGGHIPPERFGGKYVLIGLTGLGLLDSITTPLGDRRPGVQVHAQLLESFQDKHFLTRPRWMPWAEGLLLILGGLALIRWVPRWPMSRSLMLFGGWVVAETGLGFGLFSAGLLFDAATPTLGLGLVFASLMGSALIEATRQRRLAELALQHQREAAARMAGELEAARRIQLGSLPDASRLFPAEPRFKIEALLEPARAVGGDVYDFFMLDAQRLFFVVGDVSGKGVPASLFMAVAKALSKSVALRGGRDIAAIVELTNLELSRENPEMLFVSLIAGVLNVDTGLLELCNAGHDAPYRMSLNGEVMRLEGEGGPPLCILDDFPYPLIGNVQLVPGDLLCLVTDGVTEAMNEVQALYGNDRLETLLRQAQPSDSVLTIVREDIRQFVGTAEPSDDLTLLTVRWLGA